MKKFILPLLAIAISPSTFAKQPSTTENSHELFIGGGLLATNMSSENFDRNANISDQNAYGYRYQYDQTWSFDIARYNGETTSAFLLGLDDWVYPKLDFDGYMLSARAGYNISNRWRVYAQAGAGTYDLNIYKSRNDVTNYDGAAWRAAAGFQFRAYSGFGIAFEMQHMNMGDFRINGPALNFSWMF